MYLCVKKRDGKFGNICKLYRISGKTGLRFIKKHGFKSAKELKIRALEVVEVHIIHIVSL